MNETTTFVYSNALGSVTFAHSSSLWVTDFDGLSSVEVDISESRGSAQVGGSLTGQSVRPRSLTLNGAIFDPIDANRATILEVIAPTVLSTVTVYQNGESWYLEVIPEKTPEITPGVGVQYFQASLRAEYPYWRTTETYAKQIAGVTPLFRLPFNSGGVWRLSAAGESYYCDVINRGNVPCGFDLIFAARSTLTNPEIYHVGTGQRILLRKTLLAGEQIQLSTIYGQKRVTYTGEDGTVYNGFRFLSIDSDLSMALLPGSNLLRIDAATNREGLSARIEAPEGVRSGV